LPKIALIEDLTKSSVPSGSNILVEFDPSSQWYNASITIAAVWLRSGGKVSYLAYGQPPGEVRSRLRMLGLNTEALESSDRLWITDFYTAGVVGQKSKERFAVESLKVSDLSIWIGKEVLHEPAAPEFLVIAENNSILDRFNDEKHWVELLLSRALPLARTKQMTQVIGIIAGIHSEWAYKQLEAAVDGVVDFKLEETAGEPHDLVRIRTMRNVGFDRRWHKLQMDDKREATIEP
jgi:KaiC/GvpD/RAD55 family RecA-like ATPase